ncbi:MAG: hypothetical protein DI568_10205 [Sphingomonas sp.]|nr:MAG: hypothetical protein DI568_10205 [Sphingomonas sp.]
MKHSYLAPAIAALMTTVAASPAAAAITIYTINFHVQDIAGPSPFLLGSFKVSLDPDTIP